MRTLSIQGAMRHEVTAGLAESSLFSSLTEKHLEQIADRAELLQFDAGEVITTEGEPSDSFFVLLSGEAVVERASSGGERYELCRIEVFETIGEMGLLLSEPRSATVTTTERSLALRFSGELFNKLLDRVTDFGLAIARELASRLKDAGHQQPLPTYRESADALSADTMSLLPVEFVQRHRVVPISKDGRRLTLGFVDDPKPNVLASAKAILPGLELRPVRIGFGVFDAAMKTLSGASSPPPPLVGPPPPADEDADVTREFVRKDASPKLDRLLRRMIAEGASDVHLSPLRRPRWRIDGEIYEIEDHDPLGEEEVLALMDPVMNRRCRKEFGEDADTDFAYAIEDLSRFRVNLFRDAHGIGAVLRQIPNKVMSFEDLGLPDVIAKFCNLPKGLVLVTGPTGSGKSTTLAAMIDYINSSRRTHIITLEDPIEFMHASRLALINQREVGSHTTSFARALRAALREDPDIVLVGEMRDLETIALALETAQTGHLVFGTLHTSTAMGTVDRIIDQFPADQQAQIRTSLSEGLRGVVSQTLCKRIGGGRVAALEVLVVTPAVANLVRDGKTYQMVSAMQTGGKIGMRMLNEQLAQLVFSETIEADEALAKAVDKQDLMKRLGVDYPIL